MSVIDDNHVLPMDMHNVFRLCPKDSDPTSPRYSRCKVSRLMAPLISALSRQRPAWRFYGFGWGTTDYTGGHYLISRFYVVEDDEILGDLDMTNTGRSGTSYQIKNNRIYAAMQKRAYDGRSTNDVKKAVKIVLQNFYLPTLGELSLVANSAAVSIVGSKLSTSSYALRNNLDHLRDAMVEFIVDHWDQFALRPLPHGLSGHRDSLLENYMLAKDMTALSAAYNGNQGSMVLVHGERYLMSEPGSRDLAPGVPAGAVPDHIKASVGMLKLVNPEEAIPGIGVRVRSDLFYVLPGKEDV